MRVALACIAAVLFALALPALATPPRPTPKFFFGANQTDLSPQGMRTIKYAIESFALQPKGSLIRITGHTDGMERDRMALSQRRADAVKNALVREGVPAKAIVTEGRGDNDPLIPGKEGADEPQNRRAEIDFFPP